jgi:hypothetical protein
VGRFISGSGLSSTLMQSGLTRFALGSLGAHLAVKASFLLSAFDSHSLAGALSANAFPFYYLGLLLRPWGLVRSAMLKALVNVEVGESTMGRGALSAAMQNLKAVFAIAMPMVYAGVFRHFLADGERRRGTPNGPLWFNGAVNGLGLAIAAAIL